MFDRALAELSTGFINLSLDRTDESIRHALERIGSVCEVDDCTLWLWDEGLQRVQQRDEWSDGGLDAPG